MRIPQPELLLRNGEDEDDDEDEKDNGEEEGRVIEKSAVEPIGSFSDKHARRALGDGSRKDVRTAKRKRDEFTQDEEASHDRDDSMKKKKRKSVKFAETQPSGRAKRHAATTILPSLDPDYYGDEEGEEEEEEEEDDDDDDDFKPASEDSDTDEDEDKNGDSDAAVIEDLSDNEPKSSSDEIESSSGDDDSSSDSSSSGSSQATSSSSVVSEVHDAKKTKKQQLTKKVSSDHSTKEVSKKERVDPGQGLRKTFIRNQRRRDARKLRYLKSKGILPAEATLADLKAHQEAALSTQERCAAEVERTDENQAGLQASNRNKKSGMVANQQRQKTTDSESSNATAIEASSGSSSAAKAGVKTPRAKSGPSSSCSPLNDQNAKPSSRTSKLDISSSRRMVFGSLGYRAPNTASDEERIREKLMASSKRNPVPNSTVNQSAYTAQSTEEVLPRAYPDDPEFWKSRINLSAVECGDEVIDLPAPPFPFIQRWHKQRPGSSAGREQSKKAKKRGRRDSQNAYAHFTNGDNGVNGDYANPNSIVLNYDDEEGTNDPTHPSSSYYTPDTAVDGANGNITIDLPPVPEDPTTLPTPTSKDLKPGAIFAFKLLELSSATNWEPRISPYKVARLHSVELDPTVNEVAGKEGGGELGSYRSLTVALAKRDSPPRKRVRFDENGKRVYAKFEMEGFDDAEEEEEEEGEEGGGGGGGEEENGGGDDDDGVGPGGHGTNGLSSSGGKIITVGPEEVVDLRLMYGCALES